MNDGFYDRTPPFGPPDERKIVEFEAEIKEKRKQLRRAYWRLTLDTFGFLAALGLLILVLRGL